MAERHSHFKVKIAVSGAARTGHCGEGTLEMAEELGREIVRQGAILVTGATTGFPLWAAKGAKEEDGISIGLSPASSEMDHVENWGLPIDYLDLIIYTGSGFSMRDILLTRSSDAVIIGCGRIGTIHEFTVAFEDNKPIGVLRGPWVQDELVETLIKESNRESENQKIFFESDPKILVEKVLEQVNKDKKVHTKHDTKHAGKFVQVCDGDDCPLPPEPNLAG